MKARRFKYDYRESASSFHKKIGECLRNSPIFFQFNIYQEYPVSKVNPSITNNRLHYDWVILDLRVVIEVMGEQHSRPVSFCKEDPSVTIDKFYKQKERDRIKKEAAIEAGYTYLEILYHEVNSIIDEDIWLRIKANSRESQHITTRSSKKTFKEKQKERAREIRKKNYEWWKARKNQPS